MSIEFAYEDIPDLLRAIANMIENPPPDDGGGNVIPILPVPLAAVHRVA